MLVFCLSTNFYAESKANSGNKKASSGKMCSHSGNRKGNFIHLIPLQGKRVHHKNIKTQKLITSYTSTKAILQDSSPCPCSFACSSMHSSFCSQKLTAFLDKQAQELVVEALVV